MRGEERERLLRNAKSELFEAHQVLYSPGREITHVYFPVGGMVSVVVKLTNAAAVEVVTIGNEGVVGIPVVLGVTSTAMEALWQIPGRALKIPAGVLREETRRTASLNRLLKDHPQSGLLDQAHYRLGEIHYAAENFAAASNEYQQVATRFADSAYVPYALYGRGWSELKNKQFAAGAGAFTTLLTKTFLNESEWHAGISGVYGSRPSMQLAHEADCVIGVGASLNRHTLENGYMYPDARYVHIDSKAHLMMGGGRAAVATVRPFE